MSYYKEKDATMEAKNGFLYDYPRNMDEKEFHKLLDELVIFCRIKELTVTQAQMLFETCMDYVADSTLV